MATYSNPPTSQGNGSRANPLAPVAYTPQSSYVPKKETRNNSISRTSNGAYSHQSNTSTSHTAQEDTAHLSPPFNGSSAQHPLPPLQHQHPSQQPDYQQQQYQPQYGYGHGGGAARRSTDQLSISANNGSVRETASQRQLAQQPVYHPSMAKLSQVNEEQGIEPRQSFQYNSRNQDGFQADIQQDVSNLHISSPSRQRPHDATYGTSQQHAVQPSQQHHPYQPFDPQQQQFQQQHPYAEGLPYPQQSPTTSSASQLYRTSTGSSTTQTSWSQPSSPGFPPSVYNGKHGLQEPGEGSEPVYLSEAGRLLIDFNPGLLSTIAVAFREKMLQNEAKRLESANYGLEFPVTFTGKETVDVIIELTNLDHRRHALSIARSLEEQLLFFGGGINQLFDSNNDQYFFSEAALAYIPGKTEFPSVPVGVFPHSTPCYTYDCQPGGAPCYSYLCPNRQNIASVLERQNSDMSATSSQEKVWANSVPASVVAAASKKERNRQEAIFEVVNTESNYVRDLELLEEIFITPLRAGDIIPDPEKREQLIEDVFLNFQEILDLNRKLLKDLRARQEEQPLVESIGDIVLAHIIGFEPAYTRYIPRITISEFSYKKEEARNPKFSQFLKDCTRHPEARRLGLRHFIGQPYQRIPRYPLLLSEVVKRTDEGVPDRELVQEVIKTCTELGKRIDACMPEGARQLRLLTLQDKIVWKSGDVRHDLKLSQKSRKLHFECLVKRRSNLDVQMIELRLFLFDQCLLMTKEKRDKLGERDDYVYQVSKNPIPLELVHVWADEGKPMSIMNGREAVPGKKLNNSTKSTNSAHRNSTYTSGHENSVNYRVGFQETKYTASVTIEHRGRRGGVYTLYMTAADRDQFLEQMEIAQARRQEAVSGSNLFKSKVITHYGATPPLPSSNLVHNPMDGRRATCSAPYLNVLDGKRRVVIGTEEGVYVGMEDDPYSFRLALREQHVNQVSVLEAYHILLVLTGKILKAFNLSCLDRNSEKSLQIGQQLGKSVQYFTAGVCSGKTLVITMKKKNAGESHFSAYEPVENAVLGGHHRGGFSLTFGKSNKSEWFKLYREFYVGTDSSQLLMLSKMVCVVCPKGFEILMLDNLDETQVFPSKKDPNFAFLDARASSVPISMFKISSDEFLMCYSDFAFTMTKKGALAKKDLIEWEGRPESFAVAYPYVVAFEAGLIEIRHIVTGALEQIILGNNIRRLYSNVDLNGNAVIQLVMSDPNNGESRQVVKLVKAPPPEKTALEPAQPRGQQHSSPASSHLMAPVLQPVLSINGSGPAVLASHTHAGDGSFHRQQQFHQHGVAPPPIPQRPAQRLSQHLVASYPIHPYSPSTQAYPQVAIPHDFNDASVQPNGQQHHQHQHQQQQQQHQGGHAISWSSGGYP